MKRHFPVWLVLILFVWGCASTETVESTKVAPTEIYQDYSISASSSQTSISAVFRVGGGRGTTVDLDAPGKIEHNGAEMSEQPPSFLKGMTYSSYANRFDPVHRFVYTDAAGKVYRNEIRLDAVEARGDEFDLSRTEINKIPLSRRVGRDENISVTLMSETRQPSFDSNTNTNANVNFENVPRYSLDSAASLDETGTMLIIEPRQLRNFMPGKARLTIEIRKDESLKEATEKGGAISFTYQASAAVNVPK